MDCLGDLHDAKLSDLVRAGVLLDERGDRHMYRQKPFGLHARFAKPCEGDTRPERG